MAAIPGLMVFMQNPPPITVSGQNSSSAYQMTLQSVNLKEIYQWAPQLTGKMRALPGFVDVNSDMQISSPQVMVDIDRDRAVSLGITPDQVQDALFSAYSARQVSVIYAPANQYVVILEVLPQYQRTPRGALQALPAIRQQRAGAARIRGAHASPDRSAFHQPFRATARRDGLLQPAPGLLARPGGAAGGRYHPRDAHAGHYRRQLSGHGEGVPEFLRESFDSAGDRDPGDLHRAGRAVRELHPPDHDSLGAAVGGLRRVVDAGHLSQAARSVRLRGHHHAIRRGEEKRHHDDRFRHRLAEAGEQRPRFHLAGLPAALPADHDDHRGSAVRDAAHRAGLWRRRRRPPAARPRRSRRPGGQPVPDALHYTGNLPLPGAPARVAARHAGSRGSGRRGIRQQSRNQSWKNAPTNGGRPGGTRPERLRYGRRE